jgi:GTPase-associated protein 1
MMFYQLHYTSCESGLSGYSGFQFCAATPGVPDLVMREVERQTVYEPPAVMQEILDKALAEFPVNLLYAYGRESNTLIISRVQYAGLDFSNRSGNYFAHSLVSDSPSDDLASALPVELWGAPFWLAEQGDQRELPPLPPLPPSGSITPESVADFAISRALSEDHFAALLTAVEGAMTGGRQVLVIDSGTDAICRWIAAMSYLLGPVGGRQLTFSTYSYDPRRCQTHVVGTVTAAKPLRADIMTGLHVFDPAEGTVPDVAPGPAALLLARLGVSAAVGIWRLADSLAGEQGRTLTEALPTLASAALMLGHRLTVVELIESISWIHAQPSRVSASRLAAAASAALNQSLARLPATQKNQLIGIAQRVDDTAPGMDGPQLQLTEQALVAAALSEYDNGGTPGDGTTLRTVAGRKAATDGCQARLAGCDSADAIRLLAWAAAVGAALEPDTVSRVGYDAIPSLLDGHEPLGLAAAAEAWPQLRLGMVDRLAGLSREHQEAALTSPAVAVFTKEDFVSHPALGEEWLVAMAQAGRMPRVVALSRVLELRQADGAVGEGLLHRLWPDGSWAPAEAVEVVRWLPVEALADQAVRSRLSALLRDVADLTAYDSWTVLVGEFLRLPHGVLADADTQLAREFWRLIELANQAEAQAEPDALVDEMLGHYAAGNEFSRNFLNGILPPLMIRHGRLDRVLSRCDEGLFLNFCEYSADELSGNRLSLQNTANLAVAMQVMELNNPQYSATLDRGVLRPVLSKWTREQIGALAAEADLIARGFGRYNSGGHLIFWHRHIRDNRFRLSRIWTGGKR